jgi:uncharacterized protein involved in type VI secretion and phage assembly
MLSRVKVRIPALLEPDDTDAGPWAFPKGGGSANWGKNSVPPLGADVFIMFINGDIERPVWEPANHGRPVIDGQAQSEAFPEHQDPDIHVFGIGPFRLVIDDRAGNRSAIFKMVKTVGTEEQPIVWLEYNYETNSAQVYATSALGLKSEALLDIDAPAVQIKGRKVTPLNKAIN